MVGGGGGGGGREEGGRRGGGGEERGDRICHESCTHYHECSFTYSTVLVLPGGGYEALAPHEGIPPARKLCAELNVVACVLRYRLPGRCHEEASPSPSTDHHDHDPWPAPLLDLAAALRWLRSCSAKEQYGIDPDRLAILGFSAGAHYLFEKKHFCIQTELVIV